LLAPFHGGADRGRRGIELGDAVFLDDLPPATLVRGVRGALVDHLGGTVGHGPVHHVGVAGDPADVDRKSTRLNSSHVSISYAVTALHTLSLHDALPIYLLAPFHGGADRGRRGIELGDAVFLDDLPPATLVRGVRGALVDHLGGTVGHGPVHHVGVAGDPAD